MGGRGRRGHVNHVKHKFPFPPPTNQFYCESKCEIKASKLITYFMPVHQPQH
jgi:5'(3')-deoxyribonucleotidase